MKTLIVFYSRTGKTRKIAEELAVKLKADFQHITTPKNYQGVMGYLRGGKEAMKKVTPHIHVVHKDPMKYDMVIFGTPVWVGTMCPPIRTYMTKNKFKKVAFFATQGSANKQKVFDEMEKISKKPIATMFLTTKEVVTNNYDSKLKEFVRRLK